MPRATAQYSNTVPSKSPSTKPETPNISISSPPPTPSFQTSHTKEKSRDTSSQTSLSSTKKGHKKGKSSIDKLGLGKIFGNGSSAPPVPPLNGSGSRLQSPNSESPPRVPSERSDEHQSNASSVALGSSSDKEQAPTEKGKKSRRNTLTVMVEPFIGTIRRKARGAVTPGAADGSSVTSKTSQKSTTTSQEPQSAIMPPSTTTTNPPPSAYPSAARSDNEDSSVFVQSQDLPPDAFVGMNASTSKARKVMQWFRTKSKGRENVGSDGVHYEGENEKEITPTRPKFTKGFSASSNTVNQVPTTATGLVEGPQVVVTHASQSASAKFAAPGHPQRSASTAHGEAATPSFVTRFRNSVAVGGLGSSNHGQHSATNKVASPHGTLRIHHGAVDQTTITTRPPPEVMAHVKKVLEGMGVEIQLESEYKYRCIRGKKKKALQLVLLMA